MTAERQQEIRTEARRVQTMREELLRDIRTHEEEARRLRGLLRQLTGVEGEE